MGHRHRGVLRLAWIASSCGARGCLSRKLQLVTMPYTYCCVFAPGRGGQRALRSVVPVRHLVQYGLYSGSLAHVETNSSSIFVEGQPNNSKAWKNEIRARAHESVRTGVERAQVDRWSQGKSKGPAERADGSRHSSQQNQVHCMHMANPYALNSSTVTTFGTACSQLGLCRCISFGSPACSKLVLACIVCTGHSKHYSVANC